MTRFVKSYWGLFAAGLMISSQWLSASEPATSALTTVGQGHFRYVFWSVYDAELATQDGQFLDVVKSRPLALTLTYQREISRDEFIDATLDQWRHVFGTVSPAQQQWAQALTSIWQDVRDGDRLRCYVDANAVSHFYLNDQPIGAIADPLFSEQFLAIWLDERTSAPELRRALLGQKK